MGRSETSEEELSQDNSVPGMGNSAIDIPPEERQLEGGSNHVFGVCGECYLPIKYATIKLPASCEEVQENQGMNLYNIEYRDYHVSCALKKIVESGTVRVDFNTSISFKSRFKEWMAKKWIQKVKTTFNITTPTRRNTRQ